MKKTLIMLIPGLARETRNSQLASFTEGIMAASERTPVHELADDSTPPGLKRLVVSKPDGAYELSVIEGYWNDLVPSLTQAPLKTKVIRGISLLLFWLFSPIWKGIFARKYLTFGFMLAALVLVFWYLSTVLLFVEALTEESADPENGVVANVKTFANGTGWKVWLGIGSLMALLPVSLLVDISDFAKRFVTNEPNVAGKPAVRFEIVRRIREQLLQTLKSDDYTDLIVVGHSFGAVVTVDLMGDLPPLNIPVRVITMGSLIEILCKQAPWLKEDVESLSQRPDLVEWLDINCHADWFASGASVPKSPKCRELFVESYGTFADRVAARVHSRYFDHQQVVGLILNGPGPLSEPTPPAEGVEYAEGAVG